MSHETEPFRQQPDQPKVPDATEISGDAEPTSTPPGHNLWLKEVLAGIYANGKQEPDLGEKGKEAVLGEETSGRNSTVKTLYEGPSKCGCCINWVEEYPDNTKECIEDTTEAKSHALLVRMRINHDGPRPVSVHSIVIQSSLLKVVLQQILDHYPGVAAELDSVVFEAPFQCFFHRWDRLEASLKDTECQTTREHLALLHSILQEELKEMSARYKDLTSHGLMRFSDLWTIFNPGDIIYVTSGVKQSYHLGELRSTTYRNRDDDSAFKLRLRMISWDGHDMGYTRVSLSIPYFVEATPIRDLIAYPLKYHQSQNELCEGLIARGRKFQGLAGVRLVTCKGLARVPKRRFFDQDSKWQGYVACSLTQAMKRKMEELL